MSKKEVIYTTTPTGKFMLTIFGAAAELEREYILSAKLKIFYVFPRPREKTQKC